MSEAFFDHPILNSPYGYPARHWELDDQGQPTQRVIGSRRLAEFITPIPKPKKQKGAPVQGALLLDEMDGLSTQAQQYEKTASLINAVRQEVDKWRNIQNPGHWRVTPETARLLQHWRHHDFSGIRPFFCQVEAVETLIWLTEVAPQLGKAGERFLEHLVNANHDANPELMRLALKLATGAGKTTVMAMLIAWQTVNAVRHPNSKRFTRGFLIVAPGLTIRDRLWISGLEAVNRKLGITRVIDLSATPFFLRGSGYAEGTLFPWTMSDFSLMDAIECGIVKLPRVPVADNIPGAEVPVFRNLWEHIRKDMPKKGRGKAEGLDPLKLPTRLQTALEALYGHYKKTYGLWEQAGIKVPPCFIVVCNNTSTSKLVYDYIAGFRRENDDGSTSLQNGRLELFRNYDEHGNPLARPRPVKAMLDPYNPVGTTAHVNFNTSKTDRWQTDARCCHLNWVILDSGWEAEFCRVAEAHPRVKAYVKNHNLGLEAPYRYGSETRAYRPDVIVQVDDGNEDSLNLIVEIKGHRREDAKEKKATMETYWVPGVNNLKQYGRWAFAEFTEVYQMQHEFEARVEAEFNKMIDVLMQGEKTS